MIATIARDVLRALAYMHKNGGIHRDVKVRAQSMRTARTHSRRFT